VERRGTSGIDADAPRPPQTKKSLPTIPYIVGQIRSALASAFEASLLVC
jgi:hypothetical protein